ncbi:MAG TPA: T9SS type A sorting domain-containing protein, partial [Saprospiraceae bacterium]|nr:T9SS type A sorting domain-containing protein [Saprospiraceae bacterium]
TADLIKVYPNPATDNISVKLEFEKPYDNVKIRLMDNLGRMVYQKELTQTVTNHIQSIRTSEFAAGNYLLQVETAEGQRSVPVVIIK